MDGKGVTAQDITQRVTRAATNALSVLGVNAYRSAIRVAVDVLLVVPEDAPAWKPEGATLTLAGRKGVELKVVKIWSPEPIPPGGFGARVSVEAEASAEVATGTFILKLWDASGTRAVTVDGIKFP
jgi:uncharacterized protein (TIGR02268 family)